MNVTNNTKEHVTNNDTLYDVSCLVVLIVSIIGVCGNLLTLCAFQYSKKKKKYQFHVSWNHIVIFIWNLALIDLFSSVNMILLYVLMAFYPDTINQYSLCVSVISLRDIFILISATSIACIAVVTLIGVTKNNSWMNFCDSQYKVCSLIALCWVLGLICYIAKIVRIGDILYLTDTQRTFDCGTFFFELDFSTETLYSEFILHISVFTIVIVSYGVLTFYASRINNGFDNESEAVHTRDQNPSKMVFLICSVYIFQCVPYMVCRLFFAEQLRPGFFIQFSWPAKISYIVYYTQFFPNIFIYVARNANYRKAYIFFIKSVFCCQSIPDSTQHTREDTFKMNFSSKKKRQEGEQV